MLTYGDLKPGDWVQWIVSGGVPHPVKRVSRKGFSVQNRTGALVEYRWSNGQYKYARKVKMEVRAPNEWQVGDMAYCIDGGGSISKGDILKVTEVSGPSEVIVSGVTKTRASLIKFGPGRPGTFMHAGRFARVLTPEEIRNLPEGSKAVFISGQQCGYMAGQRYVVGPHFYRNANAERLDLYCALISLPEPKGLKASDLQVGDWIMVPEGASVGEGNVTGLQPGKPYRVILTAEYNDSVDVQAEEYVLNLNSRLSLQHMVKCDPPENWEQQEAIIEARNEIHEAETMLKRAKAKLDGAF